MALGKKTGGRTKGVPNRATAEVKSLAMSYMPKIIKELARLALNAESEQARVAACREMIDRAVGKPAQAIDLSNSDGTLASAWAAARVDMDREEAEVQH